MQATPDLFTILKDFGLGFAFVAILVWILYKMITWLISYVISKTFSQLLADHNMAIKQISEIKDALSGLMGDIDKVTEELSDRCKLETCPYLDELSDLCKNIYNILFQFTEDAKEARLDTKERINTIHVDLKDVTQSFLGLIKTFIDREVNRSDDSRRSSK